ncbi:Zinc finger BED domain-containing protein RICESLEEPER 2 [Linum perenne]
MGKVFFHIRQMETSEDEATRNMASRMSKNLGKYWTEKDGTNDRLNRLVYIALVLEPGHKMKYPKFALKKLYSDVRGAKLFEEVNTELQDIFEVYQSFHDARQPTTQSQSSTTIELPNMSEGAYENDFECEYSMIEYAGFRTELESYLKADREPYDPKAQQMFDILGWWKTKDVKYLVLSDIARDILVVPISTVPSESAFSTCGKVLNSFRSSLSPKIVEAVVCFGDWMRSSNFSSIQDEEDDLNVIMDAGKELEDGN